MTVVTLLVVALCGGLGAAARLALDGLIRGRSARSPGLSTFPVGTLVINVTGSFVLGLLAGLAAANAAPALLVSALGTGLMGGYTTFSTASFETVRLLQARRWVAATLNGLGMLVVAVAAGVLGILVGRLG
ncbi:CrcB family protein [Schumannella sp. 10F1B-5-1]|uniref:fluoride efflux transporter FluC n=1 Tax=Schumannella sp. 10F1B-5-1 TaxID=2590780 RepID=UPI00112FD3CA|nr:CrcB family protein [Schumannella sp. 10F1B-5-1]TPW76691.1 CrcB family protein [Schumannella sp. 10F1B-5-1]